MNKKEKFNELYYKLKEAWKNPRKKAGIKLLGYFIFFFILILVASITSHINVYDNEPSNNPLLTTTTADKYNNKQKELLTNKYSISYLINIGDKEYKINGTLENNIVSGYLELSEVIKKIVIKDNNIYEVKNNEENILEVEFNKNFISLNYIISLIKQNSAIISDSDNIKTYTYDIKDIGKIIITTNEDNITNIKIEDETSNYSLNFDN